jgi:proteic killer suppression protein
MEFANAATESIFNGESTKASRKLLPANLVTVARRKLVQLAVAEKLSDMSVPPGNRLEALTGDRLGQHSVRINDQYRVCFVWNEEKGPTAVEVVDYH